MSKSYNSSAEQNLRLCLKKYRVNKYIFKNGFSLWLQNILYDFDIRYVLWILILLRLTLLDWKPLNFQKLCKMCLEHQQVSAVHVTTVRMTRSQYREKWLEIQKNHGDNFVSKIFLWTFVHSKTWDWGAALYILLNYYFSHHKQWYVSHNIWCKLTILYTSTEKLKYSLNHFFYIQALFCFVLLWYL